MWVPVEDVSLNNAYRLPYIFIKLGGGCNLPVEAEKRVVGEE